MKLYKFKLFLLALLGYAYIFSVLALLLALIALLFWSILTGKGLNSFVIQLEIALIVVTAIILRSLWVRLPSPEGVRLTTHAQPRLFEMIDQIRRTVRGPRLHAVLLTEEFNASVVSVPRLGLFGWPRHYLLIGLPLIHVMPADEFRAAIAHEMGHLAGAHGRFSNWIYRINSTWFRLMCELTGRREWASILFDRFFRRYVSYFGAYSLTLLRSHEFAADRCAAKAVSARATAGALIRLAVYRRYIHQFWDDVWQRTRNESSPPAAFSELVEWLRRGAPENRARRWLEEALAGEAGKRDPHPLLSERLEALGEEAQLPQATTQPAAEVYLQNDLQRLIEELDRNYQQRVREEWEHFHREFRASTDELKELEHKAGERELTIEEAYQRACLTAADGKSERALVLYREVLDRDPDHALTNFQLGRLLLFEKQDEGIRFLERAMDLNEDYTLTACQIAHDYLTNQSAANHVDAQKYLRRAAAQSQVQENARAERNEVSFLDRLAAHDLSNENIEQLRRELAQDATVREAYLVRKEVKYRPDKPFYALGVVVNRPWYRQIARQWSFTKQFAYELRSPVSSFELYSFELGGHDKRLRATFRNVDNSLIYKRA